MSTADESEVNAAVWCAVAGASVDIPPVNSYVYYFPQGHYENCPIDIRSSDVVSPERPVIPCQVVSVRFYSSTTSDQLFVKFLLQPVDGDTDLSDDPVGDRENYIVSFTKIVTRTDAYSGVGFSVPRTCGELIFPRLAANQPANNLTIRDTLSKEWTFSHVYRGTTPRHLLTAGDWNKFVNEKQLDAGDSVVLMRKKSTSDHQLFIGIRRSKETTYSMPDNSGSRRDEVSAAIGAAENEQAFTVVYYPRFKSSPNFVVRAAKVDGVIGAPLMAGMPVRMAVENDEGASSGTKTLYQGTIEAVLWPERLPSPWRMLQVAWYHKPEALENMKRVNPWQVEYGIRVPCSSIRIPNRVELFKQLLIHKTESEDSRLNQKGPEVGTSSTVPIIVENFSPDETDQPRNPNPILIDFFKRDKEPEVGTSSTVPIIVEPDETQIIWVKLFGQKIPIAVEGVSENNDQHKGKDKAEETNVDDNNPPQP